jgi:hypothetical protein
MTIKGINRPYPLKDKCGEGTRRATRNDGKAQPQA